MEKLRALWIITESYLFTIDFFPYSESTLASVIHQHCYHKNLLPLLPELLFSKWANLLNDY